MTYMSDMAPCQGMIAIHSTGVDFIKKIKVYLLFTTTTINGFCCSAYVCLYMSACVYVSPCARASLIVICLLLPHAAVPVFYCALCFFVRALVLGVCISLGAHNAQAFLTSLEHLQRKTHLCGVCVCMYVCVFVCVCMCVSLCVM